MDKCNETEEGCYVMNTMVMAYGFQAINTMTSITCSRNVPLPWIKNDFSWKHANHELQIMLSIVASAWNLVRAFVKLSSSAIFQCCMTWPWQMMITMMKLTVF